MEITLCSPISTLPGVGKARREAFERLGIFTVSDLLSFFPRRYEFRNDIKSVAETFDGEKCALVLNVDSKSAPARTKNGLFIGKLSAGDDSGFIKITFFNQPYVFKALQPGTKCRFYGKVNFGPFGREMTNPTAEFIYPGAVLPPVVPVYPLTKGLTGKIIAKTVSECIFVADSLSELLPEDIREKYDLMPLSKAIKAMHTPKDEEELKKASQTVAFLQLLIFVCATADLREKATSKIGIKMETKGSKSKTFIESLPYELTGAQKRAVKDIYADLTSGNTMVRLVQGDVGSGKTAVAACALWLTVKNGYQAAMMAPTEVLAAQHFRSLCKMFSPFGINVVLLSGSLTKSKKDEIRKEIREGKVDIAVGTNALIQSSVEYKNLALAVTDEQHRFGVIQRSALISKGETGSAHTLVMSATPIPRTLSLILFGDLDVSVLDELPPGRSPVRTFLTGESKRSGVNNFIKEQLSQGRQAFIICPLIENDDEEAEESDKKAVTLYAEKAKKIFAPFKVGTLHGKLKPAEKDEIMSKFAAGEIDILISTTVVEVGVDVPNASVMLIENAECFGLSQLHQLRGRVGRGKHKSFCFLMSDSDAEKTNARLKIMTKTNDGFEIAQADLEQRGPGEFFGKKQSGKPDFICAAAADMRLVNAVKELSDEIFSSGEYYEPRFEELKAVTDRKLALENAENTVN